MATRQTVESLPSAARLATALRDVGYDFAAAVADLIDNSIAADATKVDITARWVSGDAWVRIADNGSGMDSATVNEALRFGSRRDYELDDLGKFGLGLKTASLSQCRRVLVASRTSTKIARLEARALDLDFMQDQDTWEIEILSAADRAQELTEPLETGPGTVVLWQKLDRLLPYKRQDSERARKGLANRLDLLDQQLGMIFHRFLAGEVRGRKKLAITINGTHVDPWDPFARDERRTETLQVAEFDVVHDGTVGVVTFQPFVLPNIHQFSSPSAHDHYGRGRWNQTQGLWVYRANRLIQDGGWRYLRSADEHTKYARAALDFTPELDDAFGINIAKMRVNLPTSLKDNLRAPIEALVRRAKQRYAEGNRDRPTPLPPSSRPLGAGSNVPPSPMPADDDQRQPLTELQPVPPHATRPSALDLRETIEKAAADVDESVALERIMHKVRQIDPGAAHAIGW